MELTLRISLDIYAGQVPSVIFAQERKSRDFLAMLPVLIYPTVSELRLTRYPMLHRGVRSLDLTGSCDCQRSQKRVGEFVNKCVRRTTHPKRGSWYSLPVAPQARLLNPTQKFQRRWRARAWVLCWLCREWWRRRLGWARGPESETCFCCYCCYHHPCNDSG